MEPAQAPRHLALGVLASPLTYELVERAVAAGLPESARLDWKRDLPAPRKYQGFVQDVTAMANAEGGMIVFGVDEDDTQGGAGAIVPVKLGDDKTVALRASIADTTQPVVKGVELIPLPAPGSADGILIIAVAASAERPHFVGDKTKSVLPPRYEISASLLDHRTALVSGSVLVAAELHRDRLAAATVRQHQADIIAQMDGTPSSQHIMAWLQSLSDQEVLARVQRLKEPTVRGHEAVSRTITVVEAMRDDARRFMDLAREGD